MTNLSYIIRGVTLLTGAIVSATIIFSILAVATYMFRKKEDYTMPQQYVCGYLLVVYFVSIGLVTGVLNFSSWQWNQQYSINLVPIVHNSWQLLLLNVVLFIPLGTLLPLTFRRVKWRLNGIVVIILVTTLLIELVQLFFAGREGDVDDIIANTFGGILGFLMYKGFRKIGTLHPNALREIESMPIAVSILALLWSVPYKRLCLGDVILITMMMPTWSGNTNRTFSMSGIHYTLLYSMIFLVPACIIAFRSNSGKKRKIKLGISLGSTVIIGVIFIFQAIVY